MTASTMNAPAAAAVSAHAADAPAGERSFPRWPLFLIAAPAAVAVWSGWVGLGQMSGFGVIHPLPGIADGFRLNTAITLPVGVESYGAYALGAWLTPADVPQRARVFAQWSAIAALALGMAGQVAFHLLAAAHRARAPWWVVTIVACLPVVTLAFGAALTHLLRPDARTESQPLARTGIPHTEDSRGPAAARTDPARTDPADPQRRTGRKDRAAAPAEVDRAAIVAELAAEILAAAAAGDKWRPDYKALMKRTRFKRSWCEKAVRDARTAVFRTDDTRTGGERPGEPPRTGSRAGGRTGHAGDRAAARDAALAGAGSGGEA